DNELPAYFRRADLVVLPHRDAEQSGVLYAALAFGKAIVMSDVGGFAEVAARGAGRLVPPGDPQALASAIAELLADSAAREQLARAAGADLVLDLPRGGKVKALNAAVERSRGEILAFSDANSFWEPEALRRLVQRFGDSDVGYVCGQVRFDGAGAANQEGLYW